MPKNKILVLGAGLVGKTIATDLSTSYDVTVADINRDILADLAENNDVKNLEFDVTEHKKLKKLVKEFDLVVEAVPGFLGYSTLECLIDTGVNIVDISFFPEESLDLDSFAKKKKVTAIVDCGVAPGMSNMILGYHNQKMVVRNFECYVGGLPFERDFPFQYKAPFSPIDVIEEYTRPARIYENSVIMIKEALSEREFLQFEGIGTLEAFNTDGLRSLLKTMSHIPNMKEKTMRYPGHIDAILLLKKCGFLDTNEIKVGENKVRPIDLTSKLLFKNWKLNPDDKEFTVMKIVVEGFENDSPKSYIYNLFDTYDEKTKTASMARTTGYTATAAVDLVMNKKFTRIGISPPEFIGEDENCFKSVMKHLNKRKVFYNLSN